MGTLKSVMLRLKKAAKGGNTMQKHVGGRRRIFAPQVNWYLSQVPKRNRNVIPSQIPADLASATDTHISVKTISRLLNQVGSHARKPVRCTPFNHTIVEKDYIGVRNILVGLRNDNPKWCSSTSLVSLWQVILATNYCREKGKLVLHNIIFVNVIGMTQT